MIKMQIREIGSYRRVLYAIELYAIEKKFLII